MTIIRHNPVPIPESFKAIYSHAVEASKNSRLLFISGQVGVDDKDVLGENFEEQCITAIANLEKIVLAAKMSLENIVKVTFFLTRREDLPLLKNVRSRYLSVSPAVTVLIVAGLHDPSWLVEIEAVAVA
jgi:2-iminobutanoate/2-iminopropanoate deaminase